MKDRNAIIWVFSRMRHRIPMMLGVMLASGGNALFGVLFALGSKGVIDSAVNRNKDAFVSACWVQVLIIVALVSCLALFHYLKDRLLDELDRDWKRNLLSCLLRGEYAQVSAYHSGELVNRLNNDVRILNDAIVVTLPGLVSMLVRVLGAVTVLFTIDIAFTGVLILGGIAAVLLTGIVRRKLKNLNKRVSHVNGKVLSYLQETMERLLVIQAMDLSTEVERRSDLLLEERFKTQRKKRRISLSVNAGVSLFYQIIGFGSLAWCAYQILHGRMTYGTLMVFTQLVGQLQAPFVGISGIVSQYAAMAAAAERLMDLEQISQEPSNGLKDPGAYYADMDMIGARNLSFAYDEEKIFHETTFALPKGAFATITGASGIGKSTLLKLMLGIFKPTGGELYAAGHGKEVCLSRDTRGLFAYVPQGNFIFSGTLRENIVISNPDAKQEEIEAAIHISAMDQYLHQLPDGLDTQLGENGAGLSEGQVQRLAIARAILSGAPVLLLDEATSALDSETERQVLERIAQLPDRTCIAVTHRPAALELANWRLEVAERKITVRRVGE